MPAASAPHDWIDQAAVKALQDQAAAALKINEPLHRLVALRTAQRDIAGALTQNSRRMVSPPLTEAGKAHVAAIRRRAENIKEWLPSLTVLGTCGLTIAPVIPAIILGMPALVLVGALSFLFISKLEKIGEKHLNAVEQPLRDLESQASPLSQLLGIVHAAAKNIETTLSIEEARASDYLDAALDISPALEKRFNREASRAAIKGDAKPEDIRIITKPARRDMHV